jgi:hypothetical protein
VPRTRPIRRGTVVYDVADPRLHGIVRSLHLGDRKFFANVKWIGSRETGRVLVADLRRVTADEMQAEPEPMPPLPTATMPTTIRFGIDDGYAVRYTHYEAWACYADNKWRPISAADALCKCGMLTEQVYLDTFGHRHLPLLPDHAFCTGWRSPLI